MEAMDRKGLADFLRHRRAALTPEQVGLTRVGETLRRTPGLRREEVAWLAGVSVGYYERLEQARGPRPSPQVLVAIATALQLTDTERGHLLHLAGAVPPDRPADHIPAAVLQLLDGLGDVPAYVVDAAQVIVAQNSAAVALLGDLAALPAAERSIVAIVSGTRLRCRPVPGQERGAFDRQLAGQLRAAAVRYPDAGGIDEQARSRAAVSAAFAAAWAEHDVRDRPVVPVGITHPIVGDIDLSCRHLLVPDTDLRVVLCMTEPGSASAARLAQLLHGPARVPTMT
jgi:transcriptional regulator with XRE-family HTH domain